MNMYIRNVDKITLTNALKQVNEKYKGNIVLKVCEPLNKAKRRWRVRLTVKDSHKRGARRGLQNGQYLHDACWHVHGHFFTKLPYGTVVRSVLGIHHCQLSSWGDKNVGSFVYPIHLSQCCVCVGKSFMSVKERQKRAELRLAHMEANLENEERDRVDFENMKKCLDNSVTERFAQQYRNCSD